MSIMFSLILKYYLSTVEWSVEEDVYMVFIIHYGLALFFISGNTK